MKQCFLIPYPPSVNKLYTIANKSIIKTKQYRDYEDRCLHEMMWLRLKPHTSTYKMTVRAGRPDKRRRDLDNLLKATCDVLQASGVIVDDCLCQHLSIEWSSGDGLRGWIEITLEDCLCY